MSGNDSTSRAAYVERQMKLNKELRKNNVYLEIKANVPEEDIRETVINLVVLMAKKMDLKTDTTSIEQTKKHLNELFEDTKYDLSSEGDTLVFAGKTPRKDRRYYIFYWKKQKESCYLFQCVASKHPANEQFIPSDFERAAALILGYFKENKIKARKI